MPSAGATQRSPHPLKGSSWSSCPQVLHPQHHKPGGGLHSELLYQLPLWAQSLFLTFHKQLYQIKALTLSKCFFWSHNPAERIGRDPIKSYPEGKFRMQGAHEVTH